MRWTVQPPFVRLRLRRGALHYAAHGWPVTPGAYLKDGRFCCDRPGCPTASCHPALESWERSASDRPDRVSSWWRRQPHAVLLATGYAFDVLEMPARLGLRVLCTVRLRGGAAAPGHGQLRGPVAVTPTGRWMFLVRPGDALRPELAESLDVIQHGHGSWIPAPPTLLPEGAVRWAVRPEEVRWQVPDSYAVQRIVVDARESATSPRRLPHPRSAPIESVPAVSLAQRVAVPATVPVPRQVSTLRRAM
ncbi:bifunctional DNA primase/polymerase [Solwaraspora sp. WMMD406]|uniref:bifunctional DNA primase/polymerase n=1 Tax=Solwaraspora sp. WMMD406 TaxID=3016095 RepID=UPI002415DA24|nr:bifunctional DNA primase/polymerase [Solwaraspora sp. WMMD406]MDG4765045.1 bifunctional DNA primase/polymerase [Solwaraspora sp. WMMD406]